MDNNILEDLGLTKPQAETYQALVREGASTAPEIAAVTHETRSNAYKLLDKLCQLGLATKDESDKKVHYHPASPVALEQLVQRQANEIDVRSRKLKAAMPDMLDFFFTHSEQPGVRYYRGEQGLLDMYNDQIRTKQTVYFIRGQGDIKFLGAEKAHRMRNLFPANKIDRYTIIQDVDPPTYVPPEERIPIEESDRMMRLHRTWVDSSEYSDPVEWVAYGDKVAILSFGQEIMGIIVESPQIAESFRNIFKLLDKSIRARPGYSDLPKKATYTRMPLEMVVKKKLAADKKKT